MRWVRTCSLVVVVAVGCGESPSRLGDAVACMTDLDCAEGRTCVRSEGPPRDLEASQGGAAGVGTGGCPPCPTTGCYFGEVCKSAPMPGCASSPTCVSDCADPNAVPCRVGTVCRASLCQAIRCDDPEYTGCPTGMTCDATGDLQTIRGGYSLFGTDQYPNNDVDYGPMLTESQSAAVAARCVFLRCNEAGAFSCLEGFRCDIASAPPTSTGCVGIPCGELGRCSSDAYICEPTSSKPRISRVDAHGCVTKNCEEGAPCPTGGTGATGGTAGSSGSGGEGGTVTDPNGPGVCR